MQVIVSGMGDWRYVDCVSAKGGKLEALEYVRTLFHVPKSHCVACGDSGNDILMFKGGAFCLECRGSRDSPQALDRTEVPCTPVQCCLCRRKVASCMLGAYSSPLLVTQMRSCLYSLDLYVEGAVSGKAGALRCVQVLAGSNPAIIVGNAQPELLQWLVEQPQNGRIRLTDAAMAYGILEGLALHGLR